MATILNVLEHASTALADLEGIFERICRHDDAISARAMRHEVESLHLYFRRLPGVRVRCEQPIHYRPVDGEPQPWKTILYLARLTDSYLSSAMDGLSNAPWDFRGLELHIIKLRNLIGEEWILRRLDPAQQVA
jgi:hypothetical protein